MSGTMMLCGKCNHGMHRQGCESFTATGWGWRECLCRNDVATMPPLDPDPLSTDDFIAGLYVPRSDRPRPDELVLWIALALLVLAGVVAWLVWAPR